MPRHTCLRRRRGYCLSVGVVVVVIVVVGDGYGGLDAVRDGDKEGRKWQLNKQVSWELVPGIQRVNHVTAL